MHSRVSSVVIGITANQVYTAANKITHSVSIET
uniref:Uncharacterized protein n=1 Tax=Anguilla anguilla TaxID=7936 RepID=A0A0E9SQ64_ANGAN